MKPDGTEKLPTQAMLRFYRGRSAVDVPLQDEPLTIEEDEPKSVYFHLKKHTKVIYAISAVALAFVAGSIGFFSNVVQTAVNLHQLREDVAPPGDLDGHWYVQVRAHESANRRYRDLFLVYSVTLQSNNASVTGRGQLLCENGDAVFGKAQRFVDFSGRWNQAHKLVLSWREESWKPFLLETTLNFEEGNNASLWGDFDSTLAKTRGSLIFFQLRPEQDIFDFCRRATNGLSHPSLTNNHPTLRKPRAPLLQSITSPGVRDSNSITGPFPLK